MTSHKNILSSLSPPRVGTGGFPQRGGFTPPIRRVGVLPLGGGFSPPRAGAAVVPKQVVGLFPQVFGGGGVKSDKSDVLNDLASSESYDEEPSDGVDITLGASLSPNKSKYLFSNNKQFRVFGNDFDED